MDCLPQTTSYCLFIHYCEQEDLSNHDVVCMYTYICTYVCQSSEFVVGEFLNMIFQEQTGTHVVFGIYKSFTGYKKHIFFVCVKVKYYSAPTDLKVP